MIVFLYIIFILLAALLISFVMPGFTDDLNISFYLAITAIFALSAIIIMCRKHFPFFKTLSVYIAIFLTLFVIAEGTLVYFSGDDIPSGNEQAIIVAGGGLFVESRLTAELEERLDKAIKIYSENPSLPIILSGGRDENRALPQAVAMKSYVEKQIKSLGLDMPTVITEEDSSGLYENITFSLEKAGTDSAYIIVSRHNIARSKLIASRLPYELTVTGAEYPLSKYVIYYIRELGYAIKSVILDGII